MQPADNKPIADRATARRALRLLAQKFFGLESESFPEHIQRVAKRRDPSMELHGEWSLARQEKRSMLSGEWNPSLCKRRPAHRDDRPVTEVSHLLIPWDPSGALGANRSGVDTTDSGFRLKIHQFAELAGVSTELAQRFIVATSQRCSAMSRFDTLLPLRASLFLDPPTFDNPAFAISRRPILADELGVDRNQLQPRRGSTTIEEMTPENFGFGLDEHVLALLGHTPDAIAQLEPDDRRLVILATACDRISKNLSEVMERLDLLDVEVNKAGNLILDSVGNTEICDAALAAPGEVFTL